MRYLLTIGVLLMSASMSSAAPVNFQLKQGVLLIKQGERTLPISLNFPRFTFDGKTVEAGKTAPKVDADLASGRVEAVFAPVPLDGSGKLEVKLYLKWSPEESVLRKWARFQVTGSSKKRVVEEVILEEMDGAAAGTLAGCFTDYVGNAVPSEAVQQSYPVFMNGCFMGIEFPVASTRVVNNRLLLAHRPGLYIEPGKWYETRKAVLGVTKVGDERAAFTRYIKNHQPSPKGLHANYNSWWTSPVPYTEADILKLMNVFEEKLFKPYGVSFDTFCIDMGWSNVKSVWEIDKGLFPNGFTKVQQAARRMNANLGLWVSPSSCYPGAVDNDRAKDNGFETFIAPGWGLDEFRFACLGGKSYKNRFRDTLVEMVSKYGIRHIKFDGYRFECPEAGHGHAPGSLSAEAEASGLIDVFQSVRKAAPDTWMETTCMGWNPSPWWLFHVNSVIGTYGDDAPYGRVPAPVYRESYTTARDYFNLQGSYRLPVPIAAQEVLGIVHQTGDPFMNDGVMTVMRGHMFLPLYINPSFMSDERWQSLAGLLKWTRTNAKILQQTEPILPSSWQGGKCPSFSNNDVMPREPYGYAHWQEDRGLVALRNPWIKAQKLSIKLKADDKSGPLSVVSIYPEPRLYGRDMHKGDTIDIPLAPYETVVLSIAPKQSVSDLPEIKDAKDNCINVSVKHKQIERVKFTGSEKPYGPDYTSLMGDAKSSVILEMECEADVSAPQSQLLILLEGKMPPEIPVCHIKINGKEAEAASSGSETGWAASGMPKTEHWLWLSTPLLQGKNDVALELITGDETPKVSAWIWATKPGRTGKPSLNMVLPEPEIISLDSRRVLEPFDIASISGEPVRRERPVERINGVFLDSLEPVSVSQGWGTLQKNKSILEKSMTIGGKRYLRGLGTHSPSKIVYALDGKYRRFQAWVGADGATNPSVTFEVLLDGKKAWESGLMVRDDAAKLVDLDITGVKMPELIVGDGGNGINADHAYWAEAKLLF